MRTLLDIATTREYNVEITGNWFPSVVINSGGFLPEIKELKVCVCLNIFSHGAILKMVLSYCLWDALDQVQKY